jgi:hypothetical protein
MKERNIPGGEPQAPRRWGRAQRDLVNDPYRWSHKPATPAVCPQCGAVYLDGRWSWGARPEAAVEVTCQACHRQNDDFPAGVVTLGGARLPALKAELVQLARHQETAERAEHPLNRIMDIREEGGSLVIRTTDIHLPRRIGEAVERAHKGELKSHFDEAGYFVRIDWTSRD